MKTLIMTAVVVAALTLPVFAESEDPSDMAGEATGNVKASTTGSASDPEGYMNAGRVRAGVNANAGRVRSGADAFARGSASDAEVLLNKTEHSSPINVGDKTGVSGGSDSR